MSKSDIGFPLHMPPAQPDWVKQPRLLDRLSQSKRCKLILVSAPAGYGKTTLVAEWASQNAEVASNNKGFHRYA